MWITPIKTNVHGTYFSHLSSGRARTCEELVDEQGREPVLVTELHCVLEVFLRLAREPTDYVSRYSNTGHSEINDILSSIQINIDLINI